MAAKTRPAFMSVVDAHHVTDGGPALEPGRGPLPWDQERDAHGSDVADSVGEVDDDLARHVLEECGKARKDVSMDMLRGAISRGRSLFRARVAAASVGKACAVPPSSYGQLGAIAIGGSAVASSLVADMGGGNGQGQGLARSMRTGGATPAMPHIAARGAKTPGAISPATLGEPASAGQTLDARAPLLAPTTPPPILARHMGQRASESDGDVLKPQRPSMRRGMAACGIVPQHSVEEMSYGYGFPAVMKLVPPCAAAVKKLELPDLTPEERFVTSYSSAFPGHWLDETDVLSMQLPPCKTPSRW